MEGSGCGALMRPGPFGCRWHHGPAAGRSRPVVAPAAADVGRRGIAGDTVFHLAAQTMEPREQFRGFLALLQRLVLHTLGFGLSRTGAGLESNRLTDQGEKAMAGSAAGYGSSDHHQVFAALLAGTASENHVQGRLAAARSEGTHPRTALTQAKGAATARKVRGGAATAPRQARNGPSR